MVQCRLRLNTCMYLKKKKQDKRREFTSPFTAIIVIIIITSNYIYFTCLVDHNLFNLTWKTNLCGVANTEQRDKKVTDWYLWLLMDLLLGIGTLYIQGQGWLWGRDFGEFFSKGRHGGKLHYTIFFSPDRLAQLFLLKELSPLLLAKWKNF